MGNLALGLNLELEQVLNRNKDQWFVYSAGRHHNHNFFFVFWLFPATATTSADNSANWMFKDIGLLITGRPLSHA